ncbi:MAG: SCO family protein [Alkalimonas sp.]|nr:SCO family protein [Alkalimonas sp.]
MSGWTIRHTLIAASVLTLLLVASLLWLLQSQQRDLTLQQAVFLTRPMPLPEFQLWDQYGQPVGRDDLKGQWHLLSYGFTYCPDICPMILAKLSRFQQQLVEEQRFDDVQLLFYTVDPARDTPEVMQQYLGFFAADIRGLTPLEDVAAGQNFEQSLAILYQMGAIDADNPASYQVDHGVLLYLLNPAAQLQAVFTPVNRLGDIPDFDPELLYQDYLAIRHFLQ